MGKNKLFEVFRVKEGGDSKKDEFLAAFVPRVVSGVGRLNESEVGGLK